MSSTMARVSSNGLRLGGANRLASVNAPSANAMSVAIGMPQPRALSPPAIARYSSAGTTMPPIAASTGRIAARSWRSSPVTSSRLISSPTTRKNNAISPSFTQNFRSSSRSMNEPDVHGELGVPQGVVGGAPRGVDPDERGHDRGQQEHAAGGGGLQELLEGSHDRSRHEPVGERPGRQQMGVASGWFGWFRRSGPADVVAHASSPADPSSRHTVVAAHATPAIGATQSSGRCWSRIPPRRTGVSISRHRTDMRRCLARPPGAGTLVALWQKVSTLSHPPARPRSSSSAGSPRSPPSWRRSSCSPGAATVRSGSRRQRHARDARVRLQGRRRAGRHHRRRRRPAEGGRRRRAGRQGRDCRARHLLHGGLPRSRQLAGGRLRGGAAGLLGRRPSRGRAAARTPHRRHRGRAASRRSGPWHPP